MKRIAVFIAALAAMFFAVKAFAEPLTPALCKEKATEAAKLLEAEGPSAIEKIKDPNGPFRFAEGAGYIWIHDADTNVMVMHPIKPELDGKLIADMADANGKYFFVNMSELVNAKGAGWVDYVWPKPGVKVVSPKVSYVVKATYGGKHYTVGCGMYDVTKADIQKLFPNDQFDQD